MIVECQYDGPAFVHDLGLALRGEVVRLLADDRQHVALPGFERRVLEQEQQHVALGLLGELLAPSAARPRFCLRLLLEELAAG